MNCEQVQKLLDDYYEGSLDNAELQLVEEHLNICDVCCKELETREKINFLINASNDVELPNEYYFKNLSKAVLNRVNNRFSLTRYLLGLAAVLKSLLWNPQPSYAAARIVMILFVGIFSGFFLGKLYQPQKQEIAAVATAASH